MNRTTRMLAVFTGAAILSGTGLTASASASRTAMPAATRPAEPARAITVNPAPTLLLFVPMTPCRIANTHIASSKMIAVGQTRSFYVRGNTGISGQRGNSTGCSIPNAASAVVTTVNATASTVQPMYNNAYLQGFPSDTAPTSANFLAFDNGGDSANPTLTLAANGVEPSLDIKSLGGATEVAIDVTGYYVPPISATIDGGSLTTAPSILTSTSRVLGVTRNGLGSYTIAVDCDATNCAPIVTAGNTALNAVASVLDANHITVSVANIVTAALTNGTFTISALC